MVNQLSSRGRWMVHKWLINEWMNGWLMPSKWLVGEQMGGHSLSYVYCMFHWPLINGWWMTMVTEWWINCKYISGWLIGHGWLMNGWQMVDRCLLNEYLVVDLLIHGLPMVNTRLIGGQCMINSQVMSFWFLVRSWLITSCLLNSRSMIDNSKLPLVYDG